MVRKLLLLLTATSIATTTTTIIAPILLPTHLPTYLPFFVLSAPTCRSRLNRLNRSRNKVGPFFIASRSCTYAICTDTMYSLRLVKDNDASYLCIGTYGLLITYDRTNI